jgi:hypothetical protein
MPASASALNGKLDLPDIVQPINPFLRICSANEKPEKYPVRSGRSGTACNQATIPKGPIPNTLWGTVVSRVIFVSTTPPTGVLAICPRAGQSGRGDSGGSFLAVTLPGGSHAFPIENWVEV